jgi:hypothetical protein
LTFVLQGILAHELLDLGILLPPLADHLVPSVVSDTSPNTARPPHLLSPGIIGEIRYLHFIEPEEPEPAFIEALSLAR